MDRRRFLAASGMTVMAAALRDLPLAGWQGLTTSFEDLRRGVGIFNGQGGTIGWLVNADGILIIDSQNAAAAAACIDGITGTESLPGFEDHVSPFALLSLSGVLGVAYDELGEG